MSTIPTKFHQNPSSGSGEEVENVRVYGRTMTDGRRRMDEVNQNVDRRTYGRTDRWTDRQTDRQMDVINP